MGVFHVLKRNLTRVLVFLVVVLSGMCADPTFKTKGENTQKKQEEQVGIKVLSVSPFMREFLAGETPPAMVARQGRLKGEVSLYC